MSGASHLTSTVDPTQVLSVAFERFREASDKLEGRYHDLSKEAEQLRAELSEKNRHIKKNERLAFLGETAAALAHEIRNPLGAIKLFASLLRSDVADKPGSLELVEHIHTSVETLDHLISNILQFSRGHKFDPVPVNFGILVEDQVAALQRTRASCVTFDVELHGDMNMLGHEQGLKQIIGNLLLNAVQATEPKFPQGGGKIRIAVGDADSGFGVRGESLKIIIRDNGPGIQSHVVSTLFEPFITTKNEGTGLGLAIVRQIVLQHGGEISAENNGGAVFTITLPRKFNHDSSKE